MEKQKCDLYWLADVRKNLSFFKQMAALTKNEAYGEILVDGRRRFHCKLCSRSVSTKDNILKHLFMQHRLCKY